ncbi:group III truncated hemoglobin [Oceanicella sp. SM1341]|uniref:group III truncated hemoglobin n=1 Tax=Oceanicella sp. SM1341 TaxID=1548889 RepID=UPI000E5062CA|nr:group III truncated hemoglobin [Oceanicella sp. SM1341]
MSRPARPPVPPVAEALAEGLDEAMIGRVVARFYDLARADPVIGPLFRAHVPDAKWATHVARVEDFWCSALLGTRAYDGRPMQRHLGIAGLEDAQFRRWLALFRHTATTLCPPKTAELLIGRSERIAEAFRVNIAMHSRDGITFPRPLTREPWP